MVDNKNVLILKELESGFSTGKPLSGIVRIETSFGVTDLNLSLINFATQPSGELELFILGNSSYPYVFKLPPRPTGFHITLDQTDDFKNGFAAALVFVQTDIPLTVAFGKTENNKHTLSSAKKLIAEKCLNNRKLTRKKLEQTEPERTTEPEQVEPITIEPPQPQTEASIYNDEAVATLNYFELDQQLKSNLEKIKETQNENLSNANGETVNQCQEEKKENANGTDFLSDAENLFSGTDKESSPPKPFYVTAERELNGLFQKFPPYDNLKCYFPDSRWCKINYNTDKYYIVGVIKENQKEKYICYGVPEKYSPEPPKELKGYCSFIPLSIFDMQGEGFWMLFQDAVTGECIKPT